MKKNMLNELQKIVMVYCRKMGYEYIFANENKFGFQDKHGQLWTMTYWELENKLKNQ